MSAEQTQGESVELASIYFARCVARIRRENVDNTEWNCVLSSFHFQEGIGPFLSKGMQWIF